MKRGTRRLITLVLVLVILGGLAFGGWWIWGRNTTDHQLVALGNPNPLSINNMSASLLQLHPSGAFNIKIKTGDDVHFSGFGTWNRIGSNITFTYVDAWMLNSSGVLVQNLNNFTSNTHTYRTSNGGRRIRFEDQNQWVFYFSR
ncbi:MAG: hypothetical protein FWE45_04150 [Firmicutes bacterium]|nr:hypothetical protein [Bacillota bacterium]